MDVIEDLQEICGDMYSSSHYAWNCANFVATRRKRSLTLIEEICIQVNESLEIALATGSFIQKLASNISFVLNDYKKEMDLYNITRLLQKDSCRYPTLNWILRKSICKRFDLRDANIGEQDLVENLGAYEDNTRRDPTKGIKEIVKILLCPKEKRPPEDAHKRIIDECPVQEAHFIRC